MTAINKLSNAFIRTAKTGEHCDGAGLWFRKRTDGGGQWVLRYSYHGKHRGGSYDALMGAANTKMDVED